MIAWGFVQASSAAHAHISLQRGLAFWPVTTTSLIRLALSAALQRSELNIMAGSSGSIPVTMLSGFLGSGKLVVLQT